MNIQGRIEELKTFQIYLLDFLDNNEQSEENFQKLTDLLSTHDFNSNFQELRPFLNMIQNISRNHHRSPTFNDKIFQVLTLFLDTLKQQNDSIFYIFKNDKRLLLFLIDKGVLVIDSKITDIMRNGKYKSFKYPQYFNIDGKEEYDNEKCLIGENDSYLSEIIRNDLIEDFISYINKENIDIKNSTIKPSIYETNDLLLKKKNQTLIEYSAFYGSIQIFNYLRTKEVELTPSLWEYTIHSNNAELIQILEENKIKPPHSYSKCLKEAIKCHHNEIAEYLLSNYVKPNNYHKKCALKYNNCMFYPPEFNINFENFAQACKYDHFYIAEYLLNTGKIYINDLINFPYKVKVIEEEEESIDSNKNKSEKDDDDNKLSIDWTGWNRNPKESRENRRNQIRKKWKSNCSELIVSALHLAVENENIDIVKLLINKKINVNQKMTRLYNIPQNYTGKLPDIKREEKTAFHLAVEKGNLEIVKLLSKRGRVDINEKMMDCYPSIDDTREMKTPIHIAIENNYADVVQYLSSRGEIDINLKSTFERWWSGGKEEYEEKTPLNLAAEIGNLNIFNILLSHQKIHVNTELIEFYTRGGLSYIYKRKETSFLIAIDKRHYDIVELLLSNESNDAKALSIKEYRFYDIERKKEFKTPLFLAVENNDEKMVKLLLSSEKIDIKNGLTNIGGGSNPMKGKPIGRYNPDRRTDRNKPKMVRDEKRLYYLNKRKDNCTRDGTFSPSKQYENEHRYLNMTEEEDTDDDFYFTYKVYNRISPLRAAKMIKNQSIIQILEKVSNKTQGNNNDDENK